MNTFDDLIHQHQAEKEQTTCNENGRQQCA